MGPASAFILQSQHETSRLLASLLAGFMRTRLLDPVDASKCDGNSSFSSSALFQPLSELAAARKRTRPFFHLGLDGGETADCRSESERRHVVEDNVVFLILNLKRSVRLTEPLRPS